MYCANCGAKNEDGAKFCLKCGHSLKEEPTPTPNPPFPNPPKPHGNGKAILKLIGTISVELVVLVLLIFGAYKILDNRFLQKLLLQITGKQLRTVNGQKLMITATFRKVRF